MKADIATRVDRIAMLASRLASSEVDVLNEVALLRAIHDRLIAELVMSDPTYVLPIEERERALGVTCNDSDRTGASVHPAASSSADSEKREE